MIRKIGVLLAGALSVGLMFAPAEAFARHGGGGHGHGGGGHMHHGGGGFHHGGHRGGHFGRPHFGGPRFGRPHFGGPRFGRGHFGRPFFYGRPHYGWRGPRRVFVGGGYYPPYPVRAGYRYGYGPGPGGCSTRRSVGFVPGGWRKIVTVRTCFVR